MHKMGLKTWTGATALALSLQPLMALAGFVDGQLPRPVSEPETLALVAIGAAAVMVARWIKRK